MTLDDKRKAIEVLLCCEHWNSHNAFESTWSTARAIGAPLKIASQVAERWGETRHSDGMAIYSHASICIEAAYRLIESSPLLRREWFGAR